MLNSSDAVVPKAQHLDSRATGLIITIQTSLLVWFLLFLRLQMQRIPTEDPDLYTCPTYTKEILSTRSYTLTLIMFSSLQLTEFTVKRIQPRKKKKGSHLIHTSQELETTL